MDSNNVFLKFFVILVSLVFGAGESAQAMQWKGRRQSTNVVDLRSNSPLDLAKQKLESIILNIEYRSKIPQTVQIMSKCEGGKKALALFRAESQRFRNRHRDIFKTTAKDRDLVLTEAQLAKIASATNSCAKDSSGILMNDLVAIRQKTMETRKSFQEAFQETRDKYEKDKANVKKFRDSFVGCNSGLPPRGIFGAAKSRTRNGSYEESILLSDVVEMEQEFVNGYDELIRVLNQKATHIDDSIAKFKAVGC